jgi:predicted small secreted protein
MLLAVAGCNTIGGFGEDVQAGGRAVERGAQNVEDEMND